ncbi:MAG: carboxymuconolactone decarboxylase family protein [Chloroflexota bacterium]|nr:carboxymuconolactone decarboxylase family protein [Chloroflexota bacterium]
MITDKGAKRKVYGSWKEFFPDLLFMLRNTTRLTRVYRGGLPPVLRERLMVAAAAVYGCRFCSWLHTREALRIGVDKEELARLVEGVMEGCPEEYSIAVLYAQHWAESNAHPDPEAVRRLEETYGKQKANLVNVVLRPIRLVLFAEDLWGSFLYCISFGRWGNGKGKE